MKKFLISFDFKGFMFMAKVIVKRGNGKMVILTTVINNQLKFLLEGHLMFIEEGSGFQLLLFKEDRSFEILNWELHLEYLDKTQIVNKKIFSLS